MTAQMSSRFVSERDFVANYILPKLKETSRILGKANVIEFHVIVEFGEWRSSFMHDVLPNI